MYNMYMIMMMIFYFVFTLILTMNSYMFMKIFEKNPKSKYYIYWQIIDTFWLLPYLNLWFNH